MTHFANGSVWLKRLQSNCRADEIACTTLLGFGCPCVDLSTFNRWLVRLLPDGFGTFATA
jgi:hypothetical protein